MEEAIKRSLLDERVAMAVLDQCGTSKYCSEHPDVKVLFAFIFFSFSGG